MEVSAAPGLARFAGFTASVCGALLLVSVLYRLALWFHSASLLGFGSWVVQVAALLGLFWVARRCWPEGWDLAGALVLLLFAAWLVLAYRPWLMAESAWLKTREMSYLRAEWSSALVSGPVVMALVGAGALVRRRLRKVRRSGG